MRKIMWFTIGFSLCCAIGIYLASGSLPLWLLPITLIPAVVLLLLKFIPCKIVGVIFLGFSAGVLWLWGYNAAYLEPVRQYDGELVSGSILISDYSYKTTYGCAADGKAAVEEKTYNIRVYFGENLTLAPGDWVRGNFVLGMTIPKGEEESAYYQGKGIFLLAQADGEVEVEKAEEVPVRFFAAKLRRDITEMLGRLFPEDVLGFVRALLLGDSTLLTYEEDTAFKVSGIRHVIAVSGLHVSILFGLVYSMVGKHRYLTAVFCIPVLFLFAAIAGFTPSIVRACIMQSLMMIALFLERDHDPPTALAFAVLVMLFVNPMTITSVNLQLSVGCMIGILLFSGRLSTYILLKLGWPTGKSIRARLSRWFSGGVAVTLSAMIFTTPLVAVYFGMVSVIGVLTNLAALWVISFIFYGIIFACIIGAFWLPWGKLVASFIAWPARYVLKVAKLFSSVPFAAVYTCSEYIVLWIAVCYLMFFIFLLCKKKNIFWLAGSMFVCLCISVAATCVEPRMDTFRITVFDVGEGQSILIQNEGHNFLVDCGGSSADEAADIVSETLLSQGITTLDGVILTHYDADHSAGVPGLLTRVDTDALYLPEIPDSGSYKESFTQQYSDKILWIQSNVLLTTEQSTMTLIPSVADSEDENESSLCVLFQRENCDILITGDRGRAGELALLESFDLPKLELLVAGHHGAAASTGFELLSKTRPETVVISTAGRYGHPSEKVLYRLSLFDCKVWRTDRDSTLIFRR